MSYLSKKRLEEIHRSNGLFDRTVEPATMTSQSMNGTDWPITNMGAETVQPSPSSFYQMNVQKTSQTMMRPHPEASMPMPMPTDIRSLLQYSYVDYQMGKKAIKRTNETNADRAVPESASSNYSKIGFKPQNVDDMLPPGAYFEPAMVIDPTTGEITNPEDDQQQPQSLEAVTTDQPSVESEKLELAMEQQSPCNCDNCKNIANAE